MTLLRSNELRRASKGFFMNISKKSNIFITLLLIALTFNTYSMENQDPKKTGWVALAGGVLVGGVVAYRQFLSYVQAEPIPTEQTGPINPFNFLELPQDVQKIIIALLAENSAATSLQAAAQTINSLAQTDKYLHQLINDPQFCLKLIKHLAETFDCSDEIAAKALQTQEAKHRLNMQKQFETLFLKKDFGQTEFDEFNLLYATYKKHNIFIDLNFTYGNDENKQTLLLISSTFERSSKIRMQCLLATNAVDVNYPNIYGFPPLMLCAANSDDPGAIELLCQYPTININQKNDTGETTLMYLCKICHIHYFKPANLQILIDCGADPEIRNNARMTPLQVAEKRNCQKVVTMLEDAINKKRSKQ